MGISLGDLQLYFLGLKQQIQGEFFLYYKEEKRKKEGRAQFTPDTLHPCSGHMHQELKRTTSCNLLFDLNPLPSCNWKVSLLLDYKKNVSSWQCCSLYKTHKHSAKAGSTVQVCPVRDVNQGLDYVS